MHIYYIICYKSKNTNSKYVLVCINTLYNK